jgi:hypothetical protein
MKIKEILPRLFGRSQEAPPARMTAVLIKSLLSNLDAMRNGKMLSRFQHLSTSGEWEEHIRINHGMQPSQQCIYDHLVMMRYVSGEGDQ